MRLGEGLGARSRLAQLTRAPAAQLKPYVSYSRPAPAAAEAAKAPPATAQ